MLTMVFQRLYWFLELMNQQDQRVRLNQYRYPDKLILLVELNKIHDHGIDLVNHKIVDYVHAM